VFPVISQEILVPLTEVVGMMMTERLGRWPEAPRDSKDKRQPDGSSHHRWPGD
jgi:hypothetical protein